MTYAVIFDVDGVLIDSYAPHFLSWQKMFSEIEVAFDEAQFRATFGRTNPDIFAELYPGQLTDERVRELGERKEELYREIIRVDFQPMAGAADLIDALTARQVALGVGSSGPPENVLLTLEKLERRERFAAIVTGADVVRGKPDPQVFLKAAERLGVKPDRCAVIEDAPQGIEAANRAGMTSVALTGTTTREALSHARRVVDRLDELSVDSLQALIDDGA
ncbi:MAG: HAD family phosphatase [Planctomycetales bacterium]|nr:HAD family phosphatase [Planctomycetales bacterium]